MFAKLSLSIFLVVLTGVFAVNSNAQASRQSVSGAEVTGTFRYYFTGKYKDSADEIKILALGKGKLKVSFAFTYPFVDGNGEMEANTGEAVGEAEISGDTAVYSSTDFGPCKITIKFVKPGQIKVTQNGSDAECGFGHNVSGTGTYKKISGAKPNFDDK